MAEILRPEKLRMSLYLNNENLSVLEDFRYLLGLDGRNLRSLPDFTDIIDGIVYYFYYRLNLGPEDIRTKLIQEFAKGLETKVLAYPDIEDALKEQNRYPYPPSVGYTSKIVLLKESQRKVIDKIIELINNDIEISEVQDYPEVVKKIVSLVLGEQTLIVGFFEIVYLGNLYGLLPITVMRLYSDASQTLVPLEDWELKKIKFIRSDRSSISELHRIQNEIYAVSLKKQASEMESKLFSARNQLWSLVSDFNYIDSFYGYVLSKFYFVNHYKSLTSLIVDISLNDILFKTLSKSTSGKKSTLYLYIFARYRYQLEFLNNEAIRRFTVDNKEMDNATKLGAISSTFNPFDRPQDLF